MGIQQPVMVTVNIWNDTVVGWLVEAPGVETQYATTVQSLERAIEDVAFQALSLPAQEPEKAKAGQ